MDLSSVHDRGLRTRQYTEDCNDEAVVQLPHLVPGRAEEKTKEIRLIIDDQ